MLKPQKNINQGRVHCDHNKPIVKAIVLKLKERKMTELMHKSLYQNLEKK